MPNIAWWAYEDEDEYEQRRNPQPTPRPTPAPTPQPTPQQPQLPAWVANLFRAPEQPQPYQRPALPMPPAQGPEALPQWAQSLMGALSPRTYIEPAEGMVALLSDIVTGRTSPMQFGQQLTQEAGGHVGGYDPLADIAALVRMGQQRQQQMPVTMQDIGDASRRYVGEPLQAALIQQNPLVRGAEALGLRKTESTQEYNPLSVLFPTIGMIVSDGRIDPARAYQQQQEYAQRQAPAERMAGTFAADPFGMPANIALTAIAPTAGVPAALYKAYRFLDAVDLAANILSADAPQLAAMGLGSVALKYGPGAILRAMGTSMRNWGEALPKMPTDDELAEAAARAWRESDARDYARAGQLMPETIRIVDAATGNVDTVPADVYYREVGRGAMKQARDGMSVGDRLRQWWARETGFPAEARRFAAEEAGEVRVPGAKGEEQPDIARMTREQRLAEAQRLRDESRAILSTPLMSEGALSPTQLNRMGRREQDRYTRNAMRRMEIEARIRELEQTDEAIAAQQARASEGGAAATLSQLERRIADWERAGVGAKGTIRPKYQALIDEAKAEVSDLVTRYPALQSQYAAPPAPRPEAAAPGEAQPEAAPEPAMPLAQITARFSDQEPAGRAHYGGEITIDRAQTKRYAETLESTVAHEIGHQTIEPFVLADSDRWDEALKVLQIGTVPEDAKTEWMRGQPLLFGGHVQPAEAISDAVAAYVDSGGRPRGPLTAEMVAWLEDTAERAGYGLNEIAAVSKREASRLRDELAREGPAEPAVAPAPAAAEPVAATVAPEPEAPAPRLASWVDYRDPTTAEIIPARVARRNADGTLTLDAFGPGEAHPVTQRFENVAPDAVTPRKGAAWYEAPAEPTAAEAPAVEPRPQEAAPAPAEPAGRTVTATGTDPSRQYEFRYRLADLDELIPSHTDALGLNPQYDPALQPRIRERAASQEQIENLARELNPDALLTDYQTLDRGPMIVGADNMVESGNGRVLGLRRAREMYPDKYAAYKRALRDRAEQYGLTPAEIDAMGSPVLVRERVTEVDRPAFTAEANAPSVLALSPYETARVDAEVVSDEMVAQLMVKEGQTIDAALRTRANKPFIDRFLAGVPANERAALVDADGLLNRLGIGRIKNAMIAKTYPGEHGKRIVEAFTESLDPGIKRIEEGLFASLPQMARAEALMRMGVKDAGLSIVEDLGKAIDVYRRLRENDASVSDYLVQMTMFERELTPFQESLLEYVAGVATSPTKVRDFVRFYADEVEKTPSVGQGALLDVGQVTKGGLLENVARRIEEAGKAPSRGPDLFTVAEQARAAAPAAEEAAPAARTEVGPQLERGLVEAEPLAEPPAVEAPALPAEAPTAVPPAEPPGVPVETETVAVDRPALQEALDAGVPKAEAVEATKLTLDARRELERAGIPKEGIAQVPADVTAEQVRHVAREVARATPERVEEAIAATEPAATFTGVLASIPVSPRISGETIRYVQSLLPTEVANEIAKTVKGVRVGGVSEGEGGRWDWRYQVVRIEPTDADDPETLLHELGHAYFDTFTDADFSRKYIPLRYAANTEKMLDEVARGNYASFNQFAAHNLADDLARYLLGKRLKNPELDALFASRFGDTLAQAAEPPAEGQAPLPGMGGGAGEPPEPPEPPAAAEPEGEDELARVRASREQLQPEQRTVAEIVDKFRTEYLNRFHPFAKLQKKTGIEVEWAAELVAGAVGRGESLVMQHATPVLRQVSENLEEFLDYMEIKRMQGIRALYPEAKLPGGVKNPDTALAQWEKANTPEVVEQIKQVAERFREINDRLWLQEAVRSGRLSEEGAAAMREAHPYYIPFFREGFDSSEDFHWWTARPAAHAPDTVSRRLKEEGSYRNIKDPLQSWYAGVIREQVAGARNEAAKLLIEALRKFDPDMVLEGQHTKPGWETIAYRENGELVKYTIPEEWGRAARGMDVHTLGVVERLFRVMNQPLKAGAVKFNPTFIVRNLARDLGTAWFTEGLMPFTRHWFRGLAGAFGKDETWHRAAQVGGFTGGIVDEGRYRRQLERPTTAGITARSPKEALKAIANIVPRINEAVEQGTRLAVFLKLEKEGVIGRELAHRMANSTVNFDRAGNTMRVINNIIPFSNARVQGVDRFVRQIWAHPAKSAGRMLPFVAMAAIAYLANRRFETADQIPDYEHRGNWVFIIGEGTENPDPRFPTKAPEKYPIYIKIPKPEVATVVSGLAHAMIDHAFRQQDGTLVENMLSALAEGVAEMSPVELGASQLLPPWTGTAVQLSINKDVFRGRDIVPTYEMTRPPEERYGPDETRQAIAAGRAFGISPRLIEFAINDVLAGTGQAGMWLADLTLGAIGYEPGVPGEARQQQRTPVQEAARAPVLRALVGTRGNQRERELYADIDKQLAETRRTYYENPEFRRFGMGASSPGDTVTVDGVPYEIPLDLRLRILEIETPMIKEAIDALTASPEYAELNDLQRKKAIEKQRSKIHNTVREYVLAEMQGIEAQDPSVPPGVQKQYEAYTALPGYTAMMWDGRINAPRYLTITDAQAERIQQVQAEIAMIKSVAPRKITDQQAVILYALLTNDIEGAIMSLVKVRKNPERDRYWDAHPLLDEYYNKTVPVSDPTDYWQSLLPEMARTPSATPTERVPARGWAEVSA